MRASAVAGTTGGQFPVRSNSLFSLDKICETATASPGKLALVADGREHSYRGLYRAILAARRRLAPRAQPGRVAAVLIYSIADAWPVVLGLRSLGCTTVAIDRGADMAHLARLDVALVVIRKGEMRWAEALSFAPPGAEVVEIEADVAIDGEAAGALQGAPVTALVGGHVLLTSGTTGVYKCVLLSPEREQLTAAMGALDWVVNVLQFGLWTAIGYSTAVAAWCTGSAVIVWQGPDLHRSFDYPRITHAFATPAFLARVLAGLEGEAPRHQNLRLTVFGGPLSASLARQAKARLAPMVLTAFGSSEVGGWALTEIAGPQDLKWHKIAAGWSVEVVDETGRPLPPGELGEVRVRTPESSSGGYWGDPESTARFFRDGWFHPGDLGVLDGEGRIAFHGRITNVLNIRGDKRAAEPFEQALAERLGIESVCVMSETGADHEEELHVVIETARPIPAADLAEAARATLHGFAQARFHFVETMPRNHMGKVLRGALRAQLLARKPAS